MGAGRGLHGLCVDGLGPVLPDQLNNLEQDPALLEALGPSTARWCSPVTMSKGHAGSCVHITKTPSKVLATKLQMQPPSVPRSPLPGVQEVWPRACDSC